MATCTGQPCQALDAGVAHYIVIDEVATPARLYTLLPCFVTGVTVVRPLEVFGYDDAPHGHPEVCAFR